MPYFYDVLNLGQSLVMDEMKQRSEDMRKGWTVELTSIFPPITTFKDMVIIGGYTWTLPNRRHRIIKESDAWNFGGLGWLSPADIARDYLHVKYKNRRKRITTSQYDACVKNKPQAPIHSMPCKLPDAVYIDVHSAYWSIVRAVGWDVSYNPGKWLTCQSTVEDFPCPSIKAARNCLVSLGLPGGMTVWTGERLTVQKKSNPFINLVLWRLVQDVLNGIAWEMIGIGAVYVMTDGYIVSRDTLGLAIEIIEEWGLEWTIKHEGKCRVNAPATYEFPGYKTKVPDRVKPIAMTKVYDPGISWLKHRFSKLSLRAWGRLD